jgi:hypothetical protein
VPSPTSTSSAGQVEPIGGHDAIHEPELLRIRGGQLVTQERKLLRALHADEAGQQVRTAGIDDDPPRKEGLEEVRRLRRHDQVASERQMRAETGRRTLHDRHDRLRAVEHPGDQSLCAVQDAPHPSPTAVRRLGRPIAEIGTGTEVASNAA